MRCDRGRSGALTGGCAGPEAHAAARRPSAAAAAVRHGFGVVLGEAAGARETGYRIMSSRRPLHAGRAPDAGEASPAEDRPQPRPEASWRDLTKGPLRLEPGLYLAATPIGNLRDMTLRALDALSSADRVLAEDTRQTRRLLDAYGISRRPQPYHEHNAEAVRPSILEALAAGERIVLVTDAGTPLVSDPGYKLARAAIGAGHAVRALPGASAALAALCVAGLPSDRFLFAGFPPSRSGQRRAWLGALSALDATLILFESPRRLAASLADAADLFGADRPAVVARELTKLHEEAVRASLGELAARYAAGPDPRGEIAIVIGPAEARGGQADADAALREALGRLAPAKAAAEVARLTGASKKMLYARALEIKGEDDGAPG